MHNMDQTAISTVLIADDDAVYRMFFENLLKDADYRFLEAGNGHEALSLIQNKNVDLVILDIMMPLLSGFDVLKKMKADPTVKNIPVIVVSALDDFDSIEKALTMGAQDFICKTLSEKIYINYTLITIKFK